MTITITPTDLDRAIHDTTRGEQMHITHCVIAQALRRADLPFHAIGINGVITPDYHIVPVGPVADALMVAFDARRYDDCRAMLPLTITL